VQFFLKSIVKIFKKGLEKYKMIVYTQNKGILGFSYGKQDGLFG
jgi:hypothetical protein